jgi:Flagellar assembly protein FliH
MRWFEEMPADGARRAPFADVRAVPARIPSWLAGPREAEARATDKSELAAPKLPAEFVTAVRHELAPQSLRPESGRASVRPLPEPSFTPSRGIPAVHAPASKKPSTSPPGPRVDPELAAAFQNALVEVATAHERLLGETAEQLAELAALIARRVIARELSVAPDVVRDLVREGLDALGSRDRVRVRMGSAFYEAYAALARPLLDETSRCEVRADPTLDAYGCVVETEVGRVDESIETRLRTLLTALKPDSDLPEDAP